METATLEYDGADVLDDAYVGDGELTYRPTALEEGTHTLALLDRPAAGALAGQRAAGPSRSTTPGPTSRSPGRRARPCAARRSRSSGRVNEPSTVTVDDAPVDVAARRHLLGDVPRAARRRRWRCGRSTGPATRAGIRTTIPVIAREPLVPIRAVHMTAISWETDYLREPVLDDAARQADQRDRARPEGRVGGRSATTRELPFANKIGAVEPSYVLRGRGASRSTTSAAG